MMEISLRSYNEKAKTFIIGTELLMDDTTTSNDSVSYDADEDSLCSSSDSYHEIIEVSSLQTQSFEGTKRSSTELLSDESVDNDREYDYNSYIGKKVAKDFNGILYQGIVKSYDDEREYFKIEYEDDDSEEMDFDEVRAATRLFEEERESSLTKLLLRDKYTNSKSLHQKSTSFMNILGRCREERDVFRYVDIDIFFVVFKFFYKCHFLMKRLVSP